MRLLVDINVVLDVVLEREPWVAEAALLLSAIQRTRAQGHVAGHTLPTVYYIVRENRKSATAARAAVATLLDILEVVPVEKEDFRRALTMGMADYEDAVQANCALKVGADCIVTRNPADFRKSPVRTLAPGAVLAALEAASH